MKLNKIAQCIALMGVAGLAGAQTAPTQKLDRVEVTGSSIKRAQDEGALPIQVITGADIIRSGITSAEQLVATITANGTGADNMSSNVGIQLGSTDRNNNGVAAANLRGLGAASTLVLLNGRRVSLNGAKGNTVDLNSIPLAAVQRVEVLKDGASAIYGTDAIGGVINFILRKDFKGAEVRASTDITDDGGGNIHRASVVGGTGDLATDGFNFVASLAVDRQQKLHADQRDFVNGFQPARGLSPDTAGTPFASQTGGANTAIGATYRLPTTGAQTYNRANLLSFQNKCDSVPNMSQYQSVLWNSPGFAFTCAFDYGGTEVVIQPVERINLVSRGSFALNRDTTAFVELVGSRSTSQKQFEQSQVTTSIAAGNAYPVGGPFYQDLSAYIPTFDKTKPIAYRWRCMECGLRTIDTTSDAFRLLVGIDGVIGTWDYKLGLLTGSSKVNSVLGDGYMRNAPFNAALATGKINPWLLPGQTQTAEAMALINAAKAAGTSLFGGEAQRSQFDGSISGEIMQLPAGNLSGALGFEIRDESYKFRNDSVATEPVRDAPFDAEFPKVSRSINAIYGELMVPIVKGLEAQIAVRHDRYSDFGSTTNPKIALRFSPMNEVVFRGSANTGFRAPSFFQLYGAELESPVPGNIADPVLCPQKPGDLSVCAIRPNARTGGNKTLDPETSRQWTLGVVLQPTDWLSGSIDLWQIKRSKIIYELTPQQVVANYTTFPDNIVRNGDGSINYIRAGFVNADGDSTKGVDMSVTAKGNMGAGRWSAGLDGTYNISHQQRVFATDKFVETVGKWDSRNLFVRWKHQARFTYTEGPWAGTVSQSYTSGYKDEVPLGVVPPGFNPDVSSYTLYNLSGSYSGFKNTTITVGIKNLFNTNPPFTAHNLDFAAGAGWDPRVADPRGRSFTANVGYSF